MPIVARHRDRVLGRGGFVQMKTARIGKHREVLSQVSAMGKVGCFVTASYYVSLSSFTMLPADTRRWATSRRWRRGTV